MTLKGHAAGSESAVTCRNLILFGSLVVPLTRFAQNCSLTNDVSRSVFESLANMKFFLNDGFIRDAMVLQNLKTVNIHTASLPQWSA